MGAEFDKGDTGRLPPCSNSTPIWCWRSISRLVSLCSDEFLTWLKGYLTQNGELKERLLFRDPWGGHRETQRTSDQPGRGA